MLRMMEQREREEDPEIWGPWGAAAQVLTVLTSCFVRTVSPGLDDFLFQVIELNPQRKMFLKA